VLTAYQARKQCGKPMETPGCIISQPEYQRGNQGKQEKQVELPECK
jgi:hypothetical protein